MAKRPLEKRPPVWKITRIKGTPAVDIGTVEGPETAEAAIADAIKKFKITDPQKQQRLVARRVR